MSKLHYNAKYNKRVNVIYGLKMCTCIIPGNLVSWLDLSVLKTCQNTSGSTVTDNNYSFRIY